MDFQTSTSTTQHLPETPPAMIQVMQEKKADSIGERFQDLIAEIFDNGLIAEKTKEELLQITAQAVLPLLAEQEFKMTPNIMDRYFCIKERIIEEKQKLIRASQTQILPKKIPLIKKVFSRILG